MWALVGGALLLIWGGFAWFALSGTLRASASDGLPPIVLSKGMNFRYPLDKLQPHDTRFVTYPVGLESVRLLVQRDEKGVLRAAFASCRACYSHRASHHLEKGQLICGRCQHAMRVGDPSEEITTRKGCVAVPVAFAVGQGQIEIQAQEIEQGYGKFDSN